MTGKWAATNTLREARRYISEAQMGSAAIEQALDRHDAALALVEAALDAAEKFEQGGINLSNVEFDQAATALAADLRTAREGK